MITRTELAQISIMVKQLAESTHLMNTTLSPQVFFGRLHFSLDILLELVEYEYKNSSIFPESLPSKEFNSLVEHIGETVDLFVERALISEHQKIEKLKTYKGKYNHYENFMISLISAFDCADQFWSGNQLWPHYSGPLYTDENYQRVQQLYDQLDELYGPIAQSKIELTPSNNRQYTNRRNTPDFSGSFLHIAGLPLQIGTFCKVSHFSDYLEIFSPTHRHYLAVEKISNIVVLSYKDLKKLYDKLVAADATNAAFKTLCKAIDISSKKKHLPTQTKFLLFTYRDSKAEPQSIIFQLNDGNLQDALKFTSGSSAPIRPRVDL